MKGNKKKGKNEMVIDRYTGLLFLKKRERERERETPLKSMKHFQRSNLHPR